eukprot:433047-Prymnesium_polylepis.1
MEAAGRARAVSAVWRPITRIPRGRGTTRASTILVRRATPFVEGVLDRLRRAAHLSRGGVRAASCRHRITAGGAAGRFRRDRTDGGDVRGGGGGGGGGGGDGRRRIHTINLLVAAEEGDARGAQPALGQRPLEGAVED